MKLCNSERSERRADEKVRKWRVQPDQLGRLCHFSEHCHIIDAHIVIFHAFPCFYFTMEGKEEEKGLLTVFFLLQNDREKKSRWNRIERKI